MRLRLNAAVFGIGVLYKQEYNFTSYYYFAEGLFYPPVILFRQGLYLYSCFCTIVAEQKARTAYNHLIDLSDDPGVIDTLRFLREREIVHFQRFGEALDQVQEFFATKKVF